MHRFYCEDCKNFIFGATPARLATNVNDHMLATHPIRFAGYKAEDVIRSPKHSEVPIEGERSEIRKEYTKPWALTTRSDWGSAKNPPNITEEDLEILHGLKVIW